MIDITVVEVVVAAAVVVVVVAEKNNLKEVNLSCSCVLEVGRSNEERPASRSRLG